MAKTSITVRNKKYPLEFGYGAVKYLGIYLGQETYDGTLAKVGELATAMAVKENVGGGLSFATLDVLGYMVLAGIDYAHKGEEEHGVQVEEIVDIIIKNVAIFSPIFESFMEKLPKAKEKGKPKAPKKAGARKQTP